MAEDFAWTCLLTLFLVFLFFECLSFFFDIFVLCLFGFRLFRCPWCGPETEEASKQTSNVPESVQTPHRCLDPPSPKRGLKVFGHQASKGGARLPFNLFYTLHTNKAA